MLRRPWWLDGLAATEQRDLLEILDDRHDHRSTIVAAQLPVDNWHELFSSPTVADAVLDRLVHNAHHLKLDGGSMRKFKSRLT